MDVCAVIGEYGKFQRGVFWFGLIRGTPMGLHLIVASFFLPEISHWCSPPTDVLASNWTLDSWKALALSQNNSISENGDIGRSECLMRPTRVIDGQVMLTEGTRVACTEWEYGPSFSGHSLVQEWDLVCEHAWMRSLVQSSVMTGMLLGCLICSALGDRIGRRPLLISSCAVTTIAGLVAALAPSFGVFLCARFILGISLAITQTAAFCLLVEVTGPKHRTSSAVAFTLGFTISLLILPGIVWVLQNWRHVQVAITLPFIGILIWSWFLPESPRWLVATGRMEEAASTILRAACANGTQIHDLDSVLSQLRKKILKEKEEAVKVRYTDLVRFPKVRGYSFILVISCISSGAVFYGIQLSLTSIGGDPYVSFLLGGLGDLLGVLVCYCTVRWFRRRRATPVVYGGTAICCLGLAFIPRSLVWLRRADGIVGQAVSTTAFTLSWIYAAEVFPTVLRTMGVGVCLMAIRVGSALVPFLLETKRYTHESVPMVALATIYTLAALLVLLLPETFRVALPDTLRETMELSKSKKAKADPAAKQKVELVAFEEPISRLNEEQEKQ
uniref:Putative synaptic vesicle transporter svop n=1 Tax=Amblyomma triste TaxID=251400 RepID=A0A023GNC3_AMBTT